MDPLWYKDAIIYETHVKAFFDSNGDGIGDFPGLLEKLDYLQDLGITCLWLLPFFPSPLRDDGYDIADYANVHPSYGTLDDFKKFLHAAHERHLHVVIELVINHTSDQHEWFQRARAAPEGSPERDIYVWSDTDKKYSDARIIFTDTEKSNWTWDPVANAYYWHRFFSHQPDLNFDNPVVIERVLDAMRFWFDMGVDGLRLDAIPYLVERDGTACENLPETHTVIKRIRRELDERFQGKMLLAEANQWPTDVRPYFGDGDECHMAFHFPVMPRIFMALRMEDRHPITDIMTQTPAIPETCQWGMFLRNHDELTLEMVTADERDYMYLAYSADPKMKINVGIRRRLAPLMDNNRQRIELLNSLLLSFPGTPIIYYGDEIGMGDNIYLGDRNGVRTPMQWSPDRNAGFSRANPARLYSPIIMDPVYGYEAVNVEAELSDSSSLLHWMRNMIALRKLFQVFGRGSIEFLNPANRKVLAYIRSYKADQILCVANLSRFAQAVELDLSGFAGVRPIEMFGYTEFPPVGRGPYVLSLNPYGFYWFELQHVSEAVESRSGGPTQEVAPLLAGSWRELFESAAGEILENAVLSPFLTSQKWFGGKGKTIESVRILDWAKLSTASLPSALVLVRVRYTVGEPETYFIPLAIVSADGESVAATPEKVLCGIEWNGASRLLYDGIDADETCSGLFQAMVSEGEIYGRRGSLRSAPSLNFDPFRETAGAGLKLCRSAGDHNGTSVLLGDQLMMKVYRKVDSGINPEPEMLRYLSEDARFEHVPLYLGAFEYVPFEGEAQTLAVVQSKIDDQGNGWDWMVQEVGRFYESCAALRPSPESKVPVGLSREAAITLAHRTAEMHLALARSREPAFVPEPFSRDDLGAVLEQIRQEAAGVFDLLRQSLARLSDDVAIEAEKLLGRADDLRALLEHFASIEIKASKIRIHGNYHLGQVLRVKNDYVIIDFEGEPMRSLSERRAKTSALKDLASMLRSFHSASHTALFTYASRRPEQPAGVHCASLWEEEMSAVFLDSYRRAVEGSSFAPADNVAFTKLLNIFVLEKVIQELRDEIHNRPAWVRVPIRAITGILDSEWSSE